MKFLAATAVMLFCIFTASLLGAQKLYTWTDENGVLNITDQPPPQKAQLEEVVTYKERTPEELNAIERRKNKLRRELDQEEQQEKTQDAQLKAKAADEDAQKALEQAETEYEKNKAYIDRLGNRKWKRKKFRKKIDRIKKETEESYAEAKEAAEKAEAAKKEAANAEQAQ
jgi:colicin import membrane protein